MDPIITGIKCDNPNCSWRDENVPFEEYRDWLNRPCPVCGSNLLTQEDYDAVCRLMKFCNSRIIRFLSRVVSLFDKKRYNFDLGMNGSGQIKMRKRSETDQ